MFLFRSYAARQSWLLIIRCMWKAVQTVMSNQQDFRVFCRIFFAVWVFFCASCLGTLPAVRRSLMLWMSIDVESVLYGHYLYTLLRRDFIAARQRGPPQSSRQSIMMGGPVRLYRHALVLPSFPRHSWWHLQNCLRVEMHLSCWHSNERVEYIAAAFLAYTASFKLIYNNRPSAWWKEVSLAVGAWE